jgi:hypothetical protein
MEAPPNPPLLVVGWFLDFFFLAAKNNNVLLGEEDFVVVVVGTKTNVCTATASIRNTSKEPTPTDLDVNIIFL